MKKTIIAIAVLLAVPVLVLADTLGFTIINAPLEITSSQAEGYAFFQMEERGFDLATQDQDINLEAGAGMGENTRKVNIRDSSYGIILQIDETGGIITHSPNGNCWKMSVNNSGVVGASSVTCPN